MFIDLKKRWIELVTKVEDDKSCIFSSRTQYETFKSISVLDIQFGLLIFILAELSNKENDWLDQLESKIDKSLKKSMDAEDLSEALDVCYFTLSILVLVKRFFFFNRTWTEFSDLIVHLIWIKFKV